MRNIKGVEAKGCGVGEQSQFPGFHLRQLAVVSFTRRGEGGWMEAYLLVMVSSVWNMANWRFLQDKQVERCSPWLHIQV